MTRNRPCEEATVKGCARRRSRAPGAPPSPRAAGGSRCRRLLLIGALAGCAPASDAPFSMLVSDSAGVSITTHTFDEPALEARTVRLDAARMLIGEQDAAPMQQFFNVRGTTRLADGSILVLNAGSHEVRRYTAAGEFVSSWGRRGSGPGEFQLPVLLLAGEGRATSWVFDAGTVRFTAIDKEGRRLDELRAPNRLSGLVDFLGPDHVVTAEPRRSRSDTDGVAQTPMVVGRVDLQTGQLDTLGQFGAPVHFRTLSGGRMESIPVPLTVHATVRVHNGEIYVTPGNEPVIRILGEDGSLRRVIRLDGAQRAVTRADFTRHVEHRLADAPDPTQRRRLADIYASVPIPDRYPVFDDLRITAGGRIWARRFGAVPGAQQHWLGFDPDGRFARAILLPADLVVREIGAGYVLGVQVDDLGVERVAWFELTES